jgi:hypothetical protein
MIPEEDIHRAETIGIELLRMGLEAYAKTNPAAAFALPILELALRGLMMKMRQDVADGMIVSDGHGRFVSLEWAARSAAPDQS